MRKQIVVDQEEVSSFEPKPPRNRILFLTK